MFWLSNGFGLAFFGTLDVGFLMDLVWNSMDVGGFHKNNFFLFFLFTICKEAILEN
ncbi:MAG: hypothetical protein ABI594_00980 [Ginsengibacter sp.]